MNRLIRYTGTFPSNPQGTFEAEVDTQKDFNADDRVNVKLTLFRATEKVEVVEFHFSKGTTAAALRDLFAQIAKDLQ